MQGLIVHAGSRAEERAARRSCCQLGAMAALHEQGALVPPALDSFIQHGRRAARKVLINGGARGRATEICLGLEGLTKQGK